MLDIGRIKCVVPITTGQLSLGQNGLVYTSANGKTFIVSYKYLDNLLTKNNYGKRNEQEQPE